MGLIGSLALIDSKITSSFSLIYFIVAVLRSVCDTPETGYVWWAPESVLAEVE